MDYPLKTPKDQPLVKAESLKARRWFDTFVVGSIDPIIVFDERLDIKFINQSGADLFSKKTNELVGMNIETCGALGAIIAPVLDEVLKMKIGVSCDHEIPEAAHLRIFQGSYSPVLNTEKETLGIFSVLREVTDRQNIVHELLASNKRLEAYSKVLEVFDIVSESDLSGKILYVNDRFAEISGYSRDELIGNYYRRINSNTHSKAFFQELWETISRGQPWFGEFKNRKKNGSTFWAQTIVTPIFKEDGSIARFLSIQQDITAERDERFKVAGSALRFRQILDSSPFLEVTIDLDQNITFCNKTFLAFTGYREDEIIEKNWLELFTLPDERSGIHASLIKIFESMSREVKFESQLLLKNGSLKNIKWKIAILKNLEKVIYGVHILGEEQKQEHSFLSGVQQDVLGFVSHELKAGLISVESGLRLIQENFGTQGFDEAYLLTTVKKLLQKVTHVSQVSQDMMGSLEVVARPIQIKSQPVSLRTVLLGVWNQIQVDIPPSRHFDFELRIPTKDIVVQWDPLKVEQAVRNLLSNAVQYSKPEGGKIILLAKRSKENILLSVADEGIGMPSSNVESMFNVFTRGLNTDVQQGKHFGIGLKLCKDIVSQHQGHIWIESKEGVGTTIFLLIPINPKVMKIE